MKTNREMANEVIMEVLEYDSRKKRFNKRAVMSLIAAVVLVLSLAVSVGARTGGVFSTEWRNSIKEAVLNADKAEGVEELRKEIAKSDDMFCYDNDGNEILLDYKDVIEIDKTETNVGFKFTLDKIVSGKSICMRLVGGSIADANAYFEQYVRDSYFAIIEISREDGAKLTQKDLEGHFRFGFIVEGYNPYNSTMCMEGNAMQKEYDDEYTRYIAIEVTDLIIYGDRGLGLALYNWDLNYDIENGGNIKADENGNYAFTNPINGPHAVFNFKVDDSYADKKAVKEFESWSGLAELKY